MANIEESGDGDSESLKANIQILTKRADQLQKDYDAAAASPTEAPAKPALSDDQKRLKIQFSMAKAQLKKAERALKLAEESGEGDLPQLKENITTLSKQMVDLQKELDAASASTPAPTVPEDKPVKKARPALSDEEKRKKIELAMAKAALKKAERALATAVEQDNESTEALQQKVDECRAKVEALTQ